MSEDRLMQNQNRNPDSADLDVFYLKIEIQAWLN